MKLEADLLREILLWCEEKIPDKNLTYEASDIVIPGYTPDQILYHVELLIEQGYIKAFDESGMGGYQNYMLDRLTYDGHQYIEAIKSDTVWNKYKEVAKGAGMQAVEFVLPILADIVKKQLLGIN